MTKVKFWSSDVDLYSMYFEADVRELVKQIIFEYVSKINTFEVCYRLDDTSVDQCVYQVDGLCDAYAAWKTYTNLKYEVRDASIVGDIVQSFLDYQANKPISRTKID